MNKGLLLKETAIQSEQQLKSTEKIIEELQQINKSLKDLTDAIWRLSGVYITRN